MESLRCSRENENVGGGWRDIDLWLVVKRGGWMGWKVVEEGVKSHQSIKNSPKIKI